MELLLALYAMKTDVNIFHDKTFFAYISLRRFDGICFLKSKQNLFKYFVLPKIIRREELFLTLETEIHGQKFTSAELKTPFHIFCT